jgi:tRNA A-37 threonylcarbamoyl transferase component Bud32
MKGDAAASGDRQRLAEQLWLDMRERWRQGRPVRVELYLSAGTVPPDDLDLLIDLVYAEYALREAAGEVPSLEEYFERFPQLRERLRRQITVHASLMQSVQSAGDTLPEDPRTAELEVPDRIGKYRVLAFLGMGGQARVYRAFHPDLAQEVVVKLSTAPVDEEATRQALLNEGRILAALDHPSLARIYDFDMHEGRPFIVMEHVAGQALEQYARQQPTPAQAAGLVAAVARAVAAAHRQGVVHRDVKPANIVIDAAGRPRLIDFGLAQFAGFWTADGAIEPRCFGTLPFMAPEQVRGQPPAAGVLAADARTDVFGLGGTLYFLLTGKRPYEGASVGEVLERAERGDWDRGPLRDRRIPRRLAAVCERAMAAAPQDRYPSADALAADLEAVATRRQRLLRWAALAAGMLVLAGVVALAAWPGLWATRPQGPPPTPQVLVRVSDNEKDTAHDLTYRLPVMTGNLLRIEVDRQPGWYMTLFWFGSSGKLQTLAQAAAADRATQLAYPADPGDGAEVVGPPGTEFIFVCGRRSGPVDVAAVRALCGETALPKLHDQSVVHVTRKATTLDQGKGGGSVLPRQPDWDAEVRRRLEALRVRLRDDYEIVAGVAFKHTTEQR